MPFEVGGRADKSGNSYEVRWVVKQMLRLVKEEITSITWEAVGAKEEGIDLWIKNKDGSLVCSQCKARNGSKESWSISDLGSKKVFVNAKKHLDSNENITYQFVSAVNSMMLNDITNRARNTNDSPIDFYESQIKNSEKVHDDYKRIASYFGLGYTSVQDNGQLLNYLKRMYVIHFSDDLETKKTLKETISYLFTGDSESIYNLLLNFPLENDLLGKEISSYAVLNFLESRGGISLRKLHNDERIIPRFENLNKEFVSSFVKINGSLIHRRESEECYKKVLNGNSIIIHGKAGSGKSGCIIELLNRFKQENIPYLALKLDRRVPEYSSNKYGEQLDLPASPVHCIDAIAGDKEAVLILDQLDAIRWTNSHSSTALEVCREMIEEVNHLNKERNKKISIVFSCRTFDFENDIGLKTLFSNQQNNDVENKVWKEIIISELDDKKVKEVVGGSYDNLSKKLKLLLKIPNNLYIWSNLEDSRKNNIYLSSSDLIKEWWEQLSIKIESLGVSIHSINELKDTIAKQMDKLGKLTIPKLLISDCSKVATEQLLSNGLLLSKGNSIGFVHQSFFDYFLVEKMIRKIFEGDSISNILGPISKQTPSKRYQLQMLLENLLNDDIDYFIDVGVELINSKDIRFYMKYVFFEVLGQTESVTFKVKTFLKEYINISHWKSHLLDIVFAKHPTFIKLLIQEGFITKWLNSEDERVTAMMLLGSVNSKMPDELTSLLYPLAFKENELDKMINSLFCRDIADDSDNMFEFRLELLRFRPHLCSEYIYWGLFTQKCPYRMLRLIDVIVKNFVEESIKDRNRLNKKALKNFIESAKSNPEYVWENYMPYIAKITQNVISLYDKKLNFWKSEQYTKYMYGRTYIEMIKVAGKELIKNDTVNILESCKKYYEYNSLIINEILLNVMEDCPSKYSDFVIKLLIENPHKRFFNYTGERDNYLFSAKQIIEKHSKTCSGEVFNRLENVLYYYREENELVRARRRFEFNKENRKKKSKQLVYYRYWGEVQTYLISALDQNRISRNTFQLKKILERRSNGQVNIHKKNRVSTGWVSSTIGNKAEKIKDKEWLRIITQKKYQNEKWNLSEGAILESSPEQFARDFERIGKKEPNRFAKLALELPEDIEYNYITAIFNIIGVKEPAKDIVENKAWYPVSLDLAQKLYTKWSNIYDISVVMSLCRGIRERSGELWNKDILNLITNIAKNHPNPEPGKLNIMSSKESELETIESIFMNSMNCARGCAAEAIAALLWENGDRYNDFRVAIESIVNDKDLAVNMSAIECIKPIMNYNKEFAVECFFKLAKKDLRLVSHPYANEIFYYLYKEYPEDIKELVLEMFKSRFEDVALAGAKHVANMYVFYGCFEDTIFNKFKKSKNRIEGMLGVAVTLIDTQKYHEQCKEIILQIIGENGMSEDFTYLYSRLLSEDKLNVQEDEELILRLVTSKANKGIIRDFIMFISENDVQIVVFKNVIFGICRNLIHNFNHEVNNVGSELYGVTPELSKLIALLYDKTQNDFQVNQQCLDIWDEMFENQIGTIRELTEAIMDK
ncbi:hypothetical protein [Oceanobacillus locisalsi]|uniref:ATP-binding protein n=1 Tax=Oceanobacillus locisalsi TaxID=546107 RepID=A0ABW3NP45_9BACI